MALRSRNLDETTADLSRLERVVARDPVALGELYDEHSRLLFGLILRILKDRGEAEEVLQEVFVQAWTRASTYNTQLGSPVGWLVGIARNRAIDRLRSNSVRVRTIDAVPEPPPVETPEGSAAVGERRAKELILTGKPFTAAQARDWGLVNEVFPLADLLSSG